MASSTKILQPDILQEWLEYHFETTKAFKKLKDSFSATQLAWKPTAKSWSILECMDHLITTASLYHPKIEAAISFRKDNQLQDEEGFTPSWFTQKFIAYLAPTSKTKIPAPAVFQPQSPPADMEIVTNFFSYGAELSDLIQQSDNLDLNGKKFTSPITMFVRFTLGEGLWLLVTHQARHLQQAERVSQMKDFPAS